MIRISITSAAFDAIAATLPLGSVGYEPQRTAEGGYFIWLERGWLNKLEALRQPGEGLSERYISEISFQAPQTKPAMTRTTKRLAVNSSRPGSAVGGKSIPSSDSRGEDCDALSTRQALMSVWAMRPSPEIPTMNNRDTKRFLRSWGRQRVQHRDGRVGAQSTKAR
jgi:hypothetical protein